MTALAVLMLDTVNEGDVSYPSALDYMTQDQYNVVRRRAQRFINLEKLSKREAIPKLVMVMRVLKSESDE